MKLEKKLIDRQARRTGICDVRMDNYDEVFDELIRQVTINCPERGSSMLTSGILLMKVRDEMKITVSAYKSLYESSVVFGMRKQVQAEEGVDEMENKIKDLDRKKTILENQLFELRNEYDSIEKGYEEINKYQIEENKKEIRFLEQQNSTFNDFIQSAIDLNGAENFKQLWANRKA